MNEKLRDLMLPKLRAEVLVAPETLNEKARTVEVIFYSGAAVERIPLFDDPYTLSFSLDPKAVRLARFNAGAPLVDNHDAYGSVGDVVLGVVDRAWLEKDGGHAVVRFSSRESVTPIFNDVKDGVLRNFSMGVRVHQMRDVTEKGDKQKRLLAVDWEPHELSIVPVSADPGAQALAQTERFQCSFTSSGDVAALKETKMSELDDTTKTVGDAKPDAPAPTEKLNAEDPKTLARAVEDAIERDKERAKQIRKLAAAYNLDDVWAQRHIKLGTEHEQLVADAAEKRAAQAPKVDSTISLGEDFEAIGWRVDKMADALAARAQRKAPPPPAEQFAHFSFAECGYECLSLNGRTRGRNLDARRRPEDVLKLALHTTSDFPSLLENVLNKTMLPAYQLANPIHRQIARSVTFNDLRAHNFLKQGDFPAPAELNEHGEFTSGTMSEGKEQVTAKMYGRIFGISRHILVNDDLGAFNDLATAAGRRVVDFEESTFFSTCITVASGLGPTLVEGAVAVYNAAHGNITAAGALDNTRLEAAFALMLAQTSLDGMKLSIMPGILLVSPTSFGAARRFTKEVNAEQAANVNTFAGIIEPATTAQLTGTRFYVLARPGDGSNYVYGSLPGQAGPAVEVQQGWRVAGVEVKVQRDFGTGAVDFRYGVTGAGV